MLFIGVLAYKFKILTPEMNPKLSSLLLNIILPLFIISSFDIEYSKSILKNILIILIFGFIFHGFCYLLGLVIYKKYPKEVKNILIFALIFTNCGYVGFPILDKLYGQIGVVYGSLFLLPFNVFLWTVGVFLFQDDGFKQQKINKIIFNPGIIAAFIGIIIFIFSIQLPYFIKTSFYVVGQMTTPLSMIIIGGVISNIKFKNIFIQKYIYLNVLFRLVLIPLIVYLALKPFNVDYIVLGVCIILSGTPIAVTTPVFAEIYKKDVVLSSKLVFISTLFSIISIPLIVFLLSK